MLGGMFLQWPIGRVSDAFDRRRVLTCVTFLAALFALAASWFAGHSLLGLFAHTALFGGMSMPMYSLCIADTNDYLEPDQIVPASGTFYAEEAAEEAREAAEAAEEAAARHDQA